MVWPVRSDKWKAPLKSWLLCDEQFLERRLIRWLFPLLSQAQIDELLAAYKKAHKVELADEIDKKCKGDLKALLLAKLGKNGEFQINSRLLLLDCWGASVPRLSP